MLLKTQNRRWRRGTIAVYYDAQEKEVGIETYVRRQGWTTLATVPMQLSAGDVLTGHALHDGTVRAFINGVLVGTADASPFFVDKGGYIVLWFISPSPQHAMVDDFAGGDVAP